MTEENKRKNKIIGISIGILVVLLVVISSTYAYWQITRSQTDPNVLKAACLDLKVEFGTSLSLQSEWPIESSEALRDLTGYTFTVTSTCEEETNYVIGLESVLDEKITEYMANSSVALAIDDQVLGTYDTLADLEGPTEGALASKELITSTIKKGETNTHSLKIWIDIAAPITEQSKGFAGRVFITGGQGVENDNPLAEVTPEACFEIDENGEILGYDESCGTSVTIPRAVNQIAVKTIDTNAFKEDTIIYNYDWKVIFDESYNPLYVIIINKAKEDEVKELAESSNITADIYLEGDENIPSLGEGEFEGYYSLENGISVAPVLSTDESFLGETTTKTLVSIKGLDLSKAYNLETIEEYAFSNLNAEMISAKNTDNIEYSLTSLVFGENDLAVGAGAFAFIDVKQLTTHTTLSFDFEGDTGDTPMPFYKSKIGELEIKPVGNDTEIDYFEDYISLYEAAYSYLYAFADSINTLKLGEGITYVPAGTFTLSNISNLQLPSTLKNIENFAFGGLKTSNLVIPEGVETIGNYSFAVGYFETISFPSTLRSIGKEAFGDCDNLTSISLNEGLTSIGNSAFRSSSNLVSIRIPSTITDIGNEAFYYNGTGTITMVGRSNLTGLTLGDNWQGTHSIAYEP